MKITTQRLILVPLGTEHYNTSFNYSTDHDNTRMMCYLPCDSGKEVMDYLIKCERQWSMEKPEYLDSAVLLDGAHIGAVSIELLDDRNTGELGWIIDKRYWGQGYAPEAARAFMEFFVTEYGVRHFIAHADAENKPSIRVMEKLGMTLVKAYGGRKNRGSDEIRTECLYEVCC